MTPPAYYNEHDPQAAAWLRELIARRLIVEGDVDERSIAHVRSDDLRDYTQCHFFAGIGGWSLALRLAGWPDDRRVWTGSCPCQPFSEAGRGDGTDDARHLWPVLRRLVRECRPAVLFGEQVASKAGGAWIDLVCDDLETDHYAVGAVVLPACGVGAPHLRSRWYFGGVHLEPVPELRGLPLRDPRDAHARVLVPRDRRVGRSRVPPVRDACAGGVADPARARLEGLAGDVDDGNKPRRDDTRPARSVRDVDLWAAVSVMVCRDGRSRLVPVADGVPDVVDDGGAGDTTTTAVEQRRAAMLSGYGNAVVPQAAAAFIGAYLDLESEATP